MPASAEGAIRARAAELVPTRTQLPYGEGVFRRRFVLTARPGHVVADMEDDFHRFHVELEHDGQRVLEISGDARRYPWTECTGATLPLRKLRGMPLSTSPTAAGHYTNPRENCTHLFDVATLAITHAAAGRDRRQYDIEIPDRHEGRTRAALRRDRELVLDWEVEGVRIASPKPYAGVKLRGRHFVDWVESHLDPEGAEAALALRRACFIAMGRARNLDEAPDATVYMTLAAGSCHTFTPGIAEHATRMQGTSLDFTRAPERLLADLES